MANTWMSGIEDGMVISMKDAEKRKQEMIFQLQYDEKNFLDDLKILNEVYLEPLKPHSTQLQPIANFARELQEKTQAIFMEVKDRKKKTPFVEKIADIYSINEPLRAAFDGYISNYRQNIKELEVAFTDNDTIKSLLEKQQAEPKAKGMPIDYFLRAPLVHLNFYYVFFTDLLRYTELSSLDYPFIAIAEYKFTDLAQKMGVGSGTIKIEVIEAKNIQAKDGNLYISFEFGDTERRTPSIKNISHPLWNHQDSLPTILKLSDPRNGKLTFKLFDEEDAEDPSKDDCFGTFDIPIENIPEDKELDEWYSLAESETETETNKDKDKEKVQVRLALRYLPPTPQKSVISIKSIGTLSVSAYLKVPEAKGSMGQNKYNLFTCIDFDGQLEIRKFSTIIPGNSAEPKFEDAAGIFDPTSRDSIVKISLHSSDNPHKIKEQNELLGELQIPLSTLTDCQIFESPQPLNDTNKSQKKITGDVFVRALFISTSPPVNPFTTSNPPVKKNPPEIPPLPIKNMNQQPVQTTSGAAVHKPEPKSVDVPKQASTSLPPPVEKSDQVGELVVKVLDTIGFNAESFYVFLQVEGIKPQTTDEAKRNNPKWNLSYISYQKKRH